MFDYPKWKYWILAIVAFFSALYSLPNAFLSIPSVTVAAEKRGAPADATTKGTVEGALIGKEGQKVSASSVELIDGRVIAKFPDIATQLEAAARLNQDPALKGKFNSSLTLWPTVPEWLKKIGGRSMTLGLDLRGGVQFLLEVDEKTTRDALDNRLINNLYDTFRSREISYSGVTREGGNLIASFISAEEAVKGRTAIEQAIGTEVLVQPGDGTSVTMSIRPEIVSQALLAAVEQNTTTLRERLSALAEPVVQMQGTSRIVVQLPGIQDTRQAKAAIGSTATLEYRAVDEANLGRLNEIAATGNVPPDSLLFDTKEGGKILLKKAVIASGNELINAATGVDQQSGKPAVSVTLSAAAGERMLDFTQGNVGKRMAVVYIENVPVVNAVDGKDVTTFEARKTVISDAVLQGVFGKNFQTTGLSFDEANELSMSLKNGSLAAPMKFASERVIGPSLGAENVKAGMMAVIGSFLLVLLFFVVYYKTFGVITGIALIVNLLMVVAIMSLLGATLTLPGLAGLALTVGMSVDANVLINERIREELRRGMTPLHAIDVGYEKASGTIWDANVTALLGGVALFAFGSGPIQGFAITLCLGILTSVYTAVSFSKGIAAMIYSGRKLTKLAI
jgi:preprotein translocase subunit SecD